MPLVGGAQIFVAFRRQRLTGEPPSADLMAVAARADRAGY